MNTTPVSQRMNMNRWSIAQPCSEMSRGSQWLYIRRNDERQRRRGSAPARTARPKTLPTAYSSAISSFPGSAWERTVCEALPRANKQSFDASRQAEPALQPVPRRSLGTRYTLPAELNTAVAGRSRDRSPTRLRPGRHRVAKAHSRPRATSLRPLRRRLQFRHAERH